LPILTKEFFQHTPILILLIKKLPMLTFLGLSST
jgi:hypothetical protein